MGQRFSIGAKRPREEEQEEPHDVAKRAREEEESCHDVATSSVPIVAPASPEARDGLARELHKLLSPTGAQFKVEPVPRAMHATQGLPPQIDHMITLWGHAERVERALRLVIPFVRCNNELAVAQVFWLLDRGVDRLLIALASSPVVDLCRQELNAFETITLPPHCTLRNGMINLHGSSMVKVAAKGVHFEDITLNGVGQQKRVVKIKSSLSMERCCVEGGSRAAVRIFGPGEGSTRSSSSSSGGSLIAKSCTFHSSTGDGLRVSSGRAVLEGCSVSDNGRFGVYVEGKGSFIATHSNIDRNVQSNVAAFDSAQVALHEVSSDGSKGWHGWNVEGKGSHLTANQSHASSNKGVGAWIGKGGGAALHCCECSNNELNGVSVEGKGSMFVATHSNIDRNVQSNLAVFDSAQVGLYRVSSDGSKCFHGWNVSGKGTHLTAHHSHASSNKLSGAWIGKGGSATLHCCECNENGVDGLSVGGSLAAHSCHSSSNGEDGASVFGGGSATLHSCECSDNGTSGFYAQDNSSVLVVKGESRATSNADGNAVKWDDSHLLCLENCDLEGQEVQSRM